MTLKHYVQSVKYLVICHRQVGTFEGFDKF